MTADREAAIREALEGLAAGWGPARESDEAQHLYATALDALDALEAELAAARAENERVVQEALDRNQLYADARRDLAAAREQLEQADMLLKEKSDWLEAAREEVVLMKKQRDAYIFKSDGTRKREQTLREALEEACDWLDNELAHAPDTEIAMADRELVTNWRAALAATGEQT